MKELLVKTGNRKMLDETLNRIGGVVSERPELDGSYAVRAVCSPESYEYKLNFLKFAIQNQGYAQIVGERDI